MQVMLKRYVRPTLNRLLLRDLTSLRTHATLRSSYYLGGTIAVAVFMVLLVSGTQQAASVQPSSQIEIAEGTVLRTSNAVGPDREFLPPWTTVRIVTIFGFRTPPPIGTYVTVVPLDIGIAPIDLKIIKSQTKENPCLKTAPPFVEVELESLRQRQFFDAASIGDRWPDRPFDVVLLYPAMKSARQTPTAQLTAEMLPNGVSLSTVRAAIDTGGGQRPDILVIKHCCAARRLPECELECTEKYRRKNNRWTLVGTWGPC